MIPQQTIDQIFDTARIEDVIGDFVQLKKAGGNYKGLSPWTSEKTPSFFVSPSKGIYKDFSSGKGGNVVSFLMELEAMSYPEALRYLAAKYNIDIEEAAPDPEKQAEQQHSESLALVNKFAAEFFTEQLWKTEEGKNIGLSYLRERGFTDQTLETYGIGYSPQKSTALVETAAEQGLQEKYLLELGLLKKGNHGLYDFFRGRIMFPIRNLSGRVIAFGGRTLRSDKNLAKYFNSPESDLYNKSKVLYGIYEGKRSIVAENNCYLVEGYTDVLSLHQAGIHNVVASSGTALTKEQIRLIKRYAPQVTILYDGDPAGIKASFRGIDLILQEGLQVRVLLFPEGHDPDSFAKSVSQEKLQDYLKTEAKDFIVFKTDLLLGEAQNDPIKKAGLTREIVQSIALVSDHIARSVYIKQCSRILDIPEQALLNELNKMLRKQHYDHTSVTPPPEEATPTEPLAKTDLAELSFESQEREILRVLLTYGNRNLEVEMLDEEDNEQLIEVTVAEYILHDLLEDDIQITTPIYQKIFEEYQRCIEESEDIPDASVFVKHPDPRLSEAVASLISSPHELSENWFNAHRIVTTREDEDLKRTTLDPLMRLKLNKVRMMIGEIEKQLKDASEETDVMILLQEKVKLDQKKMQISGFFGSTIL